MAQNEPETLAQLSAAWPHVQFSVVAGSLVILEGIPEVQRLNWNSSIRSTGPLRDQLRRCHEDLTRMADDPEYASRPVTFAVS